MGGLPRFLPLLVAPVVLLAGCPSGGAPAEVPLPRDVDALDPQLASAVRQAAAKIDAEHGDATRWSALGRLYHGNGLHDLAARCYAQSVALDEDDPETWYLYAIAESHLGDATQARAHMQRSVDLDPGYGGSYWRLGQWFLNDGDLERAEHWYARGTKAEPELVNNWVGLVRIALAREEADEAVELLRAHVLGGPNDGYGRQLLATAYRQLGREAEAREEAARGRGARPVLPDPRFGSVFVEKRGRSTDLTRSQGLLAQGKVADAIAILERLRAEHPDDPAVLTNLGGAYVRAARAPEALALADEAIALNPDSFRPYLIRATALEAQAGNPAALEAAIEAVERALDLNPNALDATNLAARLYLRKGDGEKALAAFVRASELDPENVALLSNVASMQRELGRTPDAVATYERVLRLAPAHMKARVGLAAIRMEQERFQGAEDLLAEALELQLKIADERHPDTRTILLRLAEAHDAQGETDKADAVRDRIR